MSARLFAVSPAPTFCQVLVNLHAPRGLLSTATVDLVIPGHVDLPAGTTASVRSTVYVSGAVLQTSAAMAFSGPVAQDYRFVQTVNLLTLAVPGPCPTIPINFKTEVRVTGPASAPAQLTAASSDGSVAGSSVLAPPC